MGGDRAANLIFSHANVVRKVDGLYRDEAGVMVGPDFIFAPDPLEGMADPVVEGPATGQQPFQRTPARLP